MRCDSRSIALRVAIARGHPLQLVKPILDPLQARGFQTRSHDAEPVTDTRADLAIETAIGHRTDCLGEALGHLIKLPRGPSLNFCAFLDVCAEFALIYRLVFRPKRALAACSTRNHITTTILRKRSILRSRPTRYGSIVSRMFSRSTKPFFREPFKKKRCLMPVSGYYEWNTLRMASSAMGPPPTTRPPSRIDFPGKDTGSMNLRASPAASRQHAFDLIEGEPARALAASGRCAPTDPQLDRSALPARCAGSRASRGARRAALPPRTRNTAPGPRARGRGSVVRSSDRGRLPAAARAAGEPRAYSRAAAPG